MQKNSKFTFIGFNLLLSSAVFAETLSTLVNINARQQQRQQEQIQAIQSQQVNQPNVRFVPPVDDKRP
ncbi:hypothetical protein, partial [Chelonobacter oris]|uniref:hypothetical protein n=1 Tax=Chelonobacter oris TaxID=505317 RepID=UPI00244CF113